MAEYHLLTIWRIEAPLEEVYASHPQFPALAGLVAHGALMRQGAEGLARRLDAPLVSQESID